MDLSKELEALPEEVRTTLEKPEVLAAVTALIDGRLKPVLDKRTELLASLAETKEVIKSFGGVDAIKALHEQKNAAEKAAQEAAGKSGDIEAVKKSYADQLAAAHGELEGLKNAAKAEKVSSAVGKAIREEKGIPELLEPHVKSRVRAELNADGTVKLVVLGANGAPMLNVDGKDATMKDLLAEFKGNATFGRAFDAPAASGSGAKGGASTGGDVANPWNPASRNFTKQNEIARATPKLAMTMAAQYGIKLDL